MTIHDQAAASPLSSGAFDDSEPVMQSHPLIEGIPVPVFGETGIWPMHATRRPARLSPSKWTLNFTRLDPVWNLRAREVSMVLLNPRHPAVITAAIPMGAQPAEVGTALATVAMLSYLANWARKRGLPADLGTWQEADIRAFIEERRPEVAPGTLSGYIATVRLLHKLGPVLTGGGLLVDPWHGKTHRQVAQYDTTRLTTPNIAPHVWFPLVKAAWTYVHVLAPDILAARSRQQQLLQTAARSIVGREALLDTYLADPANVIPLHTEESARRSATASVGDINWSVLALLIGIHPELRPFGERSRSQTAARLQDKARAAVAAGRGMTGGLLSVYTIVDRPDGTSGPWHPGLCPRTLRTECLTLKGAAYTLVAAFSMMRDSEIREITRGSVVEHYGAPAVTSMKRKHDPNRPREHWWIIEPVAEALAVAEALSWHPERVFVADEVRRDAGTFHASDLLRTFIASVNAGTGQHGLHIPPGRVAAHMFRKTMSMLTATEPGAEIALGIQLKHVATRVLANRVTQGYASTDAAWAKLLDTALDDARFTKLSEFYDDHHAGKTIGFGPGAAKLAAAFDAVKQTAEELIANNQARQGDARVEYDLLRKTRISIRFGKLNHCTLDERNPVGAKCLEGNVTIPEGHRGPLIDRCQPGRCANSIIGPEHLPIWTAERDSLLALLESRKLPPGRRALLNRQAEDVQAVIDRAASPPEKGQRA